MSDVKQRDLPKQNVRMSFDLWEKLRDIAKRRGYVNAGGRRSGDGNVPAMLADIARGRLFVGVSDDEERRRARARQDEINAARWSKRT